MALFKTTGGMIGPSIKPVLNSQVDAAKETVEGRIGGLLQTDDRGNYTNDVVRQAQDRQAQAFNARGMLNTSVAVQGGTEAAISKAIDIAAPDADKYYQNRRSNVDATNGLARDQMLSEVDWQRQQSDQKFEREQNASNQAFQLRESYQTAVQNIGANFQRQLDTINASDMTPDDKSIAIAQAQAMRDSEIAFQNNLYSRMPQWQAAWGTPSVPTKGMDVNKISNVDTLSTIANDPTQPQAVRNAALARLRALQRLPAAAPAPAAPAPGTGGGGMVWGVDGFNGVWV